MRKMTLIGALAAATWSVALPASEQTLDPRQRPWDFHLFWDIPAGAVRDVERDISCSVSFYLESAPHIMIGSNTEYDPSSEMVFFEVQATSVGRGGWLLDQWSSHEFTPWEQRLYTERDLRSRREIDAWCIWADQQAHLIKDGL